MRNVFILILAFVLASPAIADINSFREAKVKLKQDVYFDQTIKGEGTFYCGCDWRWVGKSGGRVELNSCGYKVRAQENRAKRTEYEHVTSAWALGHQRQCWQKGGRKNCVKTDPTFREMEADPHNLVIAIGEVNADRSNYSFGELPGSTSSYGQCKTKVDFKQRRVEPRNEVKGQVARINFYMHDRYNLNMSKQQQQLMMAWNSKYKVTEWEIKRDNRIAKLTGHNNPFVTGEKTWTLGHKNSGEGVKNSISQYQKVASRNNDNDGKIRGNKNSKIYHLSQGCPSYNRVSQRNVVEFSTEAEAKEAGYRKAGNCR
jgi:deoxyribonuclease I